MIVSKMRAHIPFHPSVIWDQVAAFLLSRRPVGIESGLVFQPRNLNASAPGSSTWLAQIFG